MSRTAYVNGMFLPFAEATIPINDRGFLFADGIYEVSAVLDGKLIDNEAHLARLDRSLREIRIANPHSAAQWTALQSELLRRNDLREGTVYIQVTRGVAERDFGFPADASPTVVMFTQAKAILNSGLARTGAKSSACRICDGRGATSNPSPCSPRFSRNRPLSRQAWPRRG